MNKEDRIKYYFGDYFNKTIEIVIDKKYYEFKQDQIYFYRGPEYYLLNNTLSTEHGILYHLADSYKGLSGSPLLIN